MREKLRQLRWVLMLAASAAGGAAQAGELALRWHARAGATAAFVIERRPAASRGPHAPIARVNGDARSFVDESVVDGQRYCYRVRAIRVDGAWATSDELCATALEAEPAASSPPRAERWRGETGYYVRFEGDPPPDKLAEGPRAPSEATSPPAAAAEESR